MAKYKVTIHLKNNTVLSLTRSASIKGCDRFSNWLVNSSHFGEGIWLDITDDCGSNIKINSDDISVLQVEQVVKGEGVDEFS